jgi:hypothetical protein
MKSIIAILGGLFFLILSTSAQNEVDALRFSRTSITGTARSVGLGGAVGAVGSDFTGLSINPAGIGLYSKSEFTFSPSLMWNTTNSDFKGNSYENSAYNFNLGNVGYVSNYSLNADKGWISTNFGFGYNRLNSFSKEVLMNGINNTSSLLDNFTYYANRNPNNLDQFYEQLAFDALLLPYDTVTGEYWNDPQNDGYGQNQRRTLSNSGSAGEYVFSFGANYNHRLYLGASLGINRLRFRQEMIHTENDVNNTIAFMDNFVFTEDILTRGTGYSLKLGLIARPLNFLRVGAAYHLPTFYTLRDDFTTEFQAAYDPVEDIDPTTELSPFGEFRYKLRTPSKFIGSAAITLGKIAMISADYEYLDYTSARLNSGDYDFFDENEAIGYTLKAAHNIRLGGELRMGPGYFRGGYAYYGSPYATEQPDVDSRYAIYSAGVGLRNRDFFVDLAYSVTNSRERYYMYVPGMDDGSLNTSNISNIMMTLGFRF